MEELKPAQIHGTMQRPHPPCSFISTSLSIIAACLFGETTVTSIQNYTLLYTLNLMTCFMLALPAAALLSTSVCFSIHTICHAYGFGFSFNHVSHKKDFKFTASNLIHFSLPSVTPKLNPLVYKLFLINFNYIFWLIMYLVYTSCIFLGDILTSASSVDPSTQCLIFGIDPVPGWEKAYSLLAALGRSHPCLIQRGAFSCFSTN